jgi:hypothetical protein
MPMMPLIILNMRASSKNWLRISRWSVDSYAYTNLTRTLRDGNQHDIRDTLNPLEEDELLSNISGAAWSRETVS